VSTTPQQAVGSTSPQLALDLLQPLRPSLDNFVVGRNGEALDALRRAVHGAAPDRIIYLWGEIGCGRTHLLRSLADERFAFFWSPTMIPERPGIAIVDDVDQLDGAAQIALFNRLNAVRAREDALCIAAGPLPPSQLALRDDLRTRLAWGLVCQLHALSDTEKADALARHAASRGLHISADVIPHLLSHLPRDMRTLVAALDALDAYALARKKPLTLQLAKEALAGARA
jgi:DnaA-homolog protein